MPLFCMPTGTRSRRQPGKITDISYNTFGQGLDKKTREQLAKGGQSCRDALKNLMQKWVDARIEKLRLTEQETNELRAEFAKMRKKGEEALKRFKSGKPGDANEAYDDWEQGCPNCLAPHRWALISQFCQKAIVQANVPLHQNPRSGETG